MAHTHENFSCPILEKWFSIENVKATAWLPFLYPHTRQKSVTHTHTHNRREVAKESREIKTHFRLIMAPFFI